MNLSTMRRNSAHKSSTNLYLSTSCPVLNRGITQREPFLECLVLPHDFSSR
jgi:hypothetical protein